MGGTFHTCCPTAHPHTRGLILSASDGIWNMLFSTCSHISRWVRFRFGGCLSLVVAHVRPTYHFALSRLKNLTHAVAARLRLSVPTWHHVHRRVLDIDFEPTRHWSRQFLRSLQLSWKLAALCNRHRPSEADIATEHKLLQVRVIHLCARFGISQDRMWNLDETAVRLVPKKPSQPMSSPRAPSSRSHLLQTREAACGHRLSMKRRPIECALMDHSFRASSCPTLRRTGSRRRLPLGHDRRD